MSKNFAVYRNLFSQKASLDKQRLFLTKFVATNSRANNFSHKYIPDDQRIVADDSFPLQHCHSSLPAYDLHPDSPDRWVPCRCCSMASHFGSPVARLNQLINCYITATYHKKMCVLKNLPLDSMLLAWFCARFSINCCRIIWSFSLSGLAFSSIILNRVK